jgi:hypothetical protein
MSVAVWIQTLALPALVISLFGLLIARWQLRISREKLRHDLYDRRFAIYAAFHELLVALCEQDDASSALRRASAARAHAPFLLDAPLVTFLDRLYEDAFRVHATTKLLRDGNAWSSPVERASKAAEVSEHKLRLLERIKELVGEFERFLRLKDFAKA